MKRLICFWLILSVLVPGAAVLEADGWEELSGEGYTLQVPPGMLSFGVPEEETGWNMDVILDPDGTEQSGSEVSLTVLAAPSGDWEEWLENGAFPDSQGRTEVMRRLEADEPSAEPCTEAEMIYALFLSEDGKRAEEAFVFLNPWEGDTDFVTVCRFPADDGGRYSDGLHAILETFCLQRPGRLSGSRGSFSVGDVWKNDGKHKVVRDVLVDRTAEGMYWVYAESDVTRFRVERLTWDDMTFRVTRARQLYARKRLRAGEAVSIRDWLPEILPTVRIRGVNAQGEEEVWYVMTDEEDGTIILLSEEEMAY